jgi:hypothetical protein
MTTEDRLREIMRAQRRYFGDWDEWSKVSYNGIPVAPRMVLAHVYGRHDTTPLPYAHCVLCTLFRPTTPEDGQL